MRRLRRSRLRRNGCGSPPSGATSYSYDAEGNDRRFTYNPRNQTTLLNNSLAYAGANQWELISDGSTTVENNQLGVGRTISGSTATAYYRDPDGTLLARRVGTGGREFYDHDHLGSVRGITSATGTDSATYNYWPYGEPRGTVPSSTNPFRYTGGYRTPGAIDAYHFGMRWYDTSIARWTQRDPLDQAGDIRQANRYIYVGADPSNYIDPHGMYLLEDGIEFLRSGGRFVKNRVRSMYIGAKDGAGAGSALGSAGGCAIGASEGGGTRGCAVGSAIGGTIGAAVGGTVGAVAGIFF